ncbi:MAG: PRC-barrel domain-containing protein [Planctomycetota bacterium]
MSTSVLHSKVVSEKGDLVGEISDLLLDLQHAHISTVVITRQPLESGKTQRIAVPWGVLSRNRENGIQIRCSAEKLARAPELDSKDDTTLLTRHWASSVYDHFGIKERTIKDDKPKSDVDYQLARATSLENIRVSNLGGAELGHLAGFAIAKRDGLIVFAALKVTAKDKGLQGIPLSAFIVKPPNNQWLLDISEAALTERTGFPISTWPATVDRGWSEYVHVLYGRPVFEGVRSAPNAVAVKP